MLIDGKSGKWEIVIGLEVHAQVVSNAKLFSGAATAFGAAPNAQVSLVDAAFPGMLPVINRICVEQAIKTGLGINGTINRVSVFDRKNYFYADLPAGYQISQYTRPIVSGGKVTIDLADGRTREIAVTRLHLEQDAGKSLHDQHPTKTYVDLNRSGVALMEIVSEPELRSPDEAGAYLRKLRSILRYLGTCDGNMEEGSMRCDANVSVRRPGAAEFGTRCEIKNVNSVRFVMQAIEYEARRQVALIEGGGTVDQETRLFDSDAGTTRPMRSKEHAHDYRYFPDPDLLPLELDEGVIAHIKREMPELPDAKKRRYIAMGLSDHVAALLTAEREASAYFEDVAEELTSKIETPVPEAAAAIAVMRQTIANLITGKLFAILNDRGVSIANSPISAKNFAGLLRLTFDGTISNRVMQDVAEAMADTGKDAKTVVAEKGLRQVSDSGAIAAAVDKVIADNAAKVADYRGGKQALFGWFVGQVMKATGGKANPGMVNELLKKKLVG
ncbi:MAG: Asp-tRNA(Asn)/Glu-tRNA(Gln) amidotransferase subunit GatB [Proteobacteria bacterium]|nr:Asp-tRNA(Asn)/Glu-tRNA(Gln) amidotransferase subunit GatB [Pseudomonadota bacterium]